MFHLVVTSYDILVIGLRGYVREGSRFLAAASQGAQGRTDDPDGADGDARDTRVSSPGIFYGWGSETSTFW